MSNELKTDCMTPEFIASYAHVWHPRKSYEHGEPKYSVSMVFRPGADLTQLRECAKNAAIKKFGREKAEQLMKSSSFKFPFRDGNERSDKDPIYKGATFISANSSVRPGIVKPDGGAMVFITDEMEFYSGCIARAIVNFFGFDTAGNKGVGCGLQNLVKIRDGERLGGPIPADEAFAEFAAELAENDMLS